MLKTFTNILFHKKILKQDIVELNRRAVEMKKKLLLFRCQSPVGFTKETLEDRWLIFFNFSGYVAIYLVFIRVSIPKENLISPDIGQNNGDVNK